jgi:CDP-diacylglycerol--glycerol-3-phosphate 3-phosphatidyltransferase
LPLSVPNILTVIRIALIPALVVVYYLPSRYAWAHPAAALIFALAGITDWLDGYFARRLGQTSAFGAFLDPVADKLIVATALVLLVEDAAAQRSFVSVSIALSAAVIIGREITVSALREWMAELGARARVAVSTIGKLKTTAQIVALILMLYEEPILGLPTYFIGFVCLFAAAALTLWSMFAYLRIAWPILLANEAPPGQAGQAPAPGIERHLLDTRGSANTLGHSPKRE